MRTHTVNRPVVGPWSLATSRLFWEGFTPSALGASPQLPADVLRTVFLVEADWSPATAEVEQVGDTARITLTGSGDLEAAAVQVARFLALDVDGDAWPEVGRRDPVIGQAQQLLPGFRPCGFHSPYEAAAWAVLSQRLRIVQGATLKQRLVERHGDGGAFPSPERLRTLDLDLPGRKTEYLHAVADAALEGRLDGATLRAVPAEAAIAQVRTITGLGPFAAGLVVLRGANAPDGLPLQEPRLIDEVTRRYGAQRTLEDVARAWAPYRTWATVHLRALREQRTHEMAGGSAR